jgi:hypothetical protein
MGAGASVYPKQGYAPVQLTFSAFYIFKEWLFLRLWEMRRRPWKETTRRPPPLQIGGFTPAALWAGGHVWDDDRSNYFLGPRRYPFEPRGPPFEFAPRWAPNPPG